MLHRPRSVFAALIVLTVTGTVGGAEAHIPTNPEDSALTEQVRAATAIVRGVVARVSYARSEQSSEDEPPIPHTFVTYKIQEVLKGEGQRETVTLRFMGGPDGQGGYFSVQDVPYFEEGDEDFLLIRGNGESVCPLVRCDQGRFRVVDERVYTNAGRPLYVTEKGQLVPDPAPALESRRVEVPGLGSEIEERTLELRQRLLEAAPESVREQIKREWERGVDQPAIATDQSQSEGPEGPGLGAQATADAEPLTADNFARLLANILAQERGREGRLITVDPKADFKVPAPKPAAPRAAAEREDDMTDLERRELEEMREGGGNPVIK